MSGFIDRLAGQKWLVWLSIIGLLFGRKVNISSFFGWGRVNNYLDIIIDGKMLILLGLSVVIGGFFVSKFPIQGWFGVGYLAIWEIIMIFRGYPSWFHFLERFALLFLLCVLGSYLYCKITSRWVKRVFLLGLLPFLVFDHFVLSESSVVFLLWIAILLVNAKNVTKTPILYASLFAILANVAAAASQIITGQSLGLHVFGESVLSVKSAGLAVVEFNEIRFLRGYGLFVHPNILGFFGIFSACFLLYIRPKLPLQLRWIFVILSLCLVIFCGSRSALLSGIILILIWMFSKIRKKRIQGIFGVISIMVATMLVLVRRFGSDIYRFGDLQKWLAAWENFSLQEKIFGLGFGQYPFYLQTNVPFVETWQFEPVHNVFLLLLVEVGLVPILGILGLVYWSKKKPHIS
jgi:O-antigen ligase